ncbi:hypothetical protein BDB01DRAFT_778413 [Pilobolus umbonatus]|nr:hypothetical protein BDB01DRAFT_778413 [Pilobolus umbonatus]
MKSVRLDFKNKFDDQYTFDLQNNLSTQDFHSIMGLFNHVAYISSPPGSIYLWISWLSCIWIIIIISFYLLWTQYYNPYILVTLPAFIILSSLLTLWIYRHKRTKFELHVLEICERLNATENIHGINFRFYKNQLEVTPIRIQTFSGFKTNIYAIDIEFDDRFTALKSRQFNRRSSSEEFNSIPIHHPPDSVYLHKHYAFDKNADMFHEPPSTWSQNEKAMDLV